MDLLKARERARQKAREKNQDKDKQQQASAAGEEAVPRQPQKEVKESPAELEETQQSAQESTSPDESDSTGAGEKIKPDESGDSGKSAFVSMSDFTEEDAFTDDSFGEDIPPVAEASGEDKSVDSMVLDTESASQAGEDTHPDKEKSEDAHMETPGPPVEERPAKTAPSPSSSPSYSASVEPASGHEESRASSPPVQWSVRGHADHEAEEPSGHFPAKQGPASDDVLSLEQMAPEEEDFFSLVTEELYLREFGAGASESEDQFSLLSFRLASETYAVRLTSIRQIIKLVPITMVPRVPDYVLGIISLRGTVIPIFDLRRILKLPEAESTRKSRIIIVNQGKCAAGLIVDEVEQVVRMSESAIEPPPPVLGGVEADYIRGIGRVDSRMIIFLSLEKIMVPVG